MKKIISLLIITVLLFSSFCVSVNASEEPDFTTREYWKQQGCIILNNVVYRKDKKSCTVKEFFTTDEAGNYIKELVIAEKIDGLPVTKIQFSDASEDGFYRDIKDLTRIKKIVLPDTIKGIGEGTFYGFEAVEKLNIPKSLKYIGRAAFYNVKSLKKLKLPDTVTYIGERAFFRMESLEKFVFPPKVKNVPEQAFTFCYNLKKVKISAKATEIGWEAFAECKNLESITIPKSVKKIYNDAFHSCKKLAKVVIKCYKAPEVQSSAFHITKKGIRFQVRTRAIAKQFKKQLKEKGTNKAKIYVGKKLIYKNITDDYWRRIKKN